MLFKPRNYDFNECKFLNISCINPCIFIKDLDKNIIKFQKSNDMISWESSIYIKFIDFNIFPFVNIDLKACQIKYITQNLISLRSFFEYICKDITKINLLLNELFCFINFCKNNNFLHGNLQIDNIYLNEKDYTKFYFIDYSNSFILDTPNYPKFKRTSFMNEFDSKINDNYLCFWDFFTVYISIKNYFHNDKNILLLLEKIIVFYIPIKILSKISLKYIS